MNRHRTYTMSMEIGIRLCFCTRALMLYHLHLKYIPLRQCKQLIRPIQNTSSLPCYPTVSLSVPVSFWHLSFQHPWSNLTVYLCYEIVFICILYLSKYLYNISRSATSYLSIHQFLCLFQFLFDIFHFSTLEIMWHYTCTMQLYSSVFYI